MSGLFIQLLPVVVMGLIIAAVFLISKQSVKKQQKSKRSINWMLGTYGLVLLIGTVLYYALPSDKFASNQVDDSVQLAALERADLNIYERAQKGTIKESEEIIIKEKYEFPLEGSQLNIKKPNEDIYILTVIEQTDSVDNVIEVIEYSARSIAGNVDITDRMPPLKVLFSENNLSLLGPDIVDMDIAMFSNEFTIKQFTGEPSLFDLRNVRGTSIIYVRVPSGIEVNGDVEFVQQ